MSNAEGSNFQGVSLYLQEIKIKITKEIRIKLELEQDSKAISLRQESPTTWTPAPSLELLATSNLRFVMTGHRKRDRLFRLGKPEARVEVTGEILTKLFWEGKDSWTSEISFHDHTATVTLSLKPSNTLEMTRTAVQSLETEMKNYRPLISKTTEQYIGHALDIGEVFSELNPIAKTAFSIAKKTFKVLKEQQKHDDMIPELAKNVQEILPFADITINDIITNGEMDTLEAAATELLNLIEKTASFICEYVKESPALRIGKSLASSQYKEKIKELKGEFSKLKESFDRALSIENLKQTMNIDNRLILKRLKPTTHAGYKEDRKCMDGTRTEILDTILHWSTQTQPTEESSEIKTIYWLHGTPGMGKTALATSLCMKLHGRRRLAGSFFCRRDDPVLHEPKYILPAIIYHLAGLWAPYGKAVAGALRNDSQLGVETTSRLLEELVLVPLKSMKKSPSHPLVIVIDALDECGDAFTRKSLLGSLVECTKHASWLRFVLTSRPEEDIHSFLYSPLVGGSLAIRDLVQAQASNDIRLFLETQFSSIATRCNLANWPSDSALNTIIERSGGIFIYAETVYQFIKDKIDPIIALEQILVKNSDRAVKRLDELYQKAVELVIGDDEDELGTLRRVIGAIIAVSSYRALRDETLAALLDVKPHIVKNVTNKLGSLFYRDAVDGGLRARHLSIIDFFMDPSTPQSLRVELEATNAELGIGCLKTMSRELRFNICRLETSYCLNSDIEDLDNRVHQHISDALQYSCLHHSSHLGSGGEPTKDAKSHLTAVLACEKVLHWVEVMSLLGGIPIAVSSLRQLRTWIKDHQEPCRDLVADTLRFLTTFYAVITSSAPHIYISALPFSPSQSLIWKNTKDLFYNLLNVKEGRLKSWPAFPHEWSGHSGRVTSIACSPDGLRVASGSADKTVRIWDAETGEILGKPLIGHKETVDSVTFSHDSRLVISHSEKSTIRIWDIQTGEPILLSLSAHSFTTIACSPTDLHIATGSLDGTIRIWDLRTGDPVGEPFVGHTGRVQSLAYSPDGSKIVSASEDGTVQVWNTQTNAPIGRPWKGHTDDVTSVAFSSDGLQVASTSWHGTVHIRDAQTRKKVRPLYSNRKSGRTTAHRNITYSPNNSRITCEHKEGILVLDVITGDVIPQPFDMRAGIRTITCSHNGTLIISGHLNGTIRIWDAQTYEPVGLISAAETQSTQSIAFSPDNSRIISLSTNGTVQNWSAFTGEPIGKPVKCFTGNLLCSSFSPDCSHVAFALANGDFYIWDLSTGKNVNHISNNLTNLVWDLAYSPDGGKIATASGDHTIQIWDASICKPIGRPLKGHTKRVRDVTFSPDGSQIASCSQDGTILIWNVQTQEKVIRLLKRYGDSVERIAYSPNGSHIASINNNNSVLIWDAHTGNVVHHIFGPKDASGIDIIYSPDGTQIMCGIGNTVDFLDAQTGQCIGKPLGGTEKITYIAYSSDGSQIISSSDSRIIRVWNAKTVPFHNLSLGLDTDVDIEMDKDGWIHQEDQRLLWVQEDCRPGLSAALFTIPKIGRHRRVQIDISQMSHGSSWTNIFVAPSVQ